MVQRRIPLTIYQPAKPGVRSFALLASMEAAARSVLISVYPVLMYRSLGDAKTVSEVYFVIGLATLAVALATPFIGRFVPRRFLYTGAGLLMMSGNMVGMFAGLAFIPLAVAMSTMALVMLTIGFNAYVMDYIERHSLGRNESSRLLYSAAAWTIGPALGVWLMDKSPQAPFILSTIASICQMAFFWWLRLGDGKVITRALKPVVNPLAYLPRFLAQPLLLSGWIFSVIRSVGWYVYIVYVPIFAVESGLSSQLGGLAVSVSNGFLFFSPLILRYLQATSVRFAIGTGFVGSSSLFFLAWLMSGEPMTAILLMMGATFFLVMLDVSGGLPFLMSVKPSERTEMAAVYSTFRDVSAVLSPAAVRIVLVAAPLPAVFAVTALALVSCALVTTRIHPKLGMRRLR